VPVTSAGAGGGGAGEAVGAPVGLHVARATPMTTAPTTALAAALTVDSDVADPGHGALQEVQDQSLLADLFVDVERPVARGERHHLTWDSA